MMPINSVSISGNLGRDPEIRQTQAGTYVMRFVVAIGEKRSDGQGGRVDYTHWVDCVLFDKTGNRVNWFSEHMAKGTKVAVSGKLNYSSWEAKDGTKRSKLEVLANDIEVMTPQQQGGQYSPPRPTTNAQVDQRPMPRQDDDLYDDSIPF